MSVRVRSHVSVSWSWAIQTRMLQCALKHEVHLMTLSYLWGVPGGVSASDKPPKPQVMALVFRSLFLGVRLVFRSLFLGVRSAGSWSASDLLWNAENICPAGFCDFRPVQHTSLVKALHPIPNFTEKLEIGGQTSNNLPIQNVA